MATLTTADITAIEKEVFVTDNLAKQYDEGTLLLDLIEKGDQGNDKFISMLGTHDGKYAVIPLHTGPNPNAGVGVREGREYPGEGGQAVSNAKYRSKKVAVVRGLTTEVMSRVGGNPQSAINWTAFDASKTMDNCRWRMDYYLHGDGSGMIATCEGTYVNTTGVLTVNSTANIFVGSELSLRERSSGTNATAMQGTLPTNSLASGVSHIPYRVSAVDATNNKVTIVNGNNGATMTAAQVDGITNTMGVFLWDSQGSVPFGLDSYCAQNNPPNHGYNGAAAATTFTDENGVSRAVGAIDRTLAANAFWQPSTATNCAGAPLSITDHIQPLSTTLLQRDTSLIRGTDLIFLLPRAAWWQVINDLESGKRTMIRTTITDGKYDAVQYDVFTFCFSFQQPASTGYVFAPKYLFRMITTPWQEVTLAGSNYGDIIGPIMNRPTDKWRNRWFTEQELVGNSCRATNKVTNIGT